MRNSHEAIYHYLYLLPRGQVRKSMINLLHRAKPKRRAKNKSKRAQRSNPGQHRHRRALS
jgi:hypothetical protein